MNEVQISCRGNGPDGETVLDEPISVKISLSDLGREFSVEPKDCPFNTGGHAQRCKASHPEVDKLGEGVCCPFSFDYPYEAEHPYWEKPDKVRHTVITTINRISKARS